MQERFLQVAIGIAAVVLVVLGARRLWERMGAPSNELASALTLSAELAGAGGMPSGLLDEAPGSEQGGFFVADLRERAGTPSGPQEPTSLAGPWPAPFADALCAGDDAAWMQVSALVDALDPVQPPSSEAIDALAAIALAGCMRPGSARTCAWATEAITRGAAHAPFGWALLAHCGDEVALPLLDRADAPGPAVIRFLVAREAMGRRPVRLPAYLLPSVELALAAPPPARERFPFVELANALGHYDDPSATRALVTLYGVAPGYARDAIGIAIHFPDDDRARAIHQESCATAAAGSYVRACHDGSLAARVGSWAFDPHLELARHPERRDEVLAALEQCSSGADPMAGAMCFRRLAELDRARAGALAMGRTAAARVPLLGIAGIGDPPPYVSGLEEELRRFPTQDALDAALVAAGIGPRGDATSTARPPITVLETLVARGHALGIDPESGTFPVPYDLVLRRLARLVTPALDDVVFAQITPEPSQMAVGRYALRAFRAGRVYETYARNYGDFYDVEAIVGFVNALLVRRGALARCVLARDTEGAAVYFVCASAPQLAALREAQLLVEP
jgi:hypothetical protein